VFESKPLHGRARYEASLKKAAEREVLPEDVEGTTATFNVAVGPYAGTDRTRTRKEAHDAFVHRLESHGHSPEHARQVAHRCARRHDDKR